ncbi:MAG: methylated-DNA--[protein]-cysteine S-methyltransferase [Gammaproteobacteria bacterium]|jgi:methylated-DNA-[protein]-cysteine S-methyltransferase|nr:methylated-DNA--[protein]-cysteine S-methyltransferase [Gammaproteobacteria bacterium]
MTRKPAPRPEPYDAALRTPIGWVGLRAAGAAIAAVDIVDLCPTVRPGPVPAVATQAVEALQRYFRTGELADLPLAPAGTPFQRRVWERLQRISRGCTATYGELARELRTSPRAVGGACRANPVPLLIPCHRVVARGGLGGYSGERGGDWAEKKRWLLRHEDVAL